MAMIVSALVVTLPALPAARPDVIDALTRDPRLLVGVPVADRLPVVAEAESARAGADLVDHLRTVDGVVAVDVVSIDFEVS